MSLTASGVKSAKPQAKPYKLSDEKGLYKQALTAYLARWLFASHRGEDTDPIAPNRHVLGHALTSNPASFARRAYCSWLAMQTLVDLIEHVDPVRPDPFWTEDFPEAEAYVDAREQEYSHLLRGDRSHREALMSGAPNGPRLHKIVMDWRKSLPRAPNDGS